MEGAVKSIRVAVVDDHAVVRMGLKFALMVFKDIQFVGEHEDGEGAAQFVSQTAPDVVLLDIRMPKRDGVAALGDILAAKPSQKVVMLTTVGTEEAVYRSLTLGAKGYVLKDSRPQDIVDAIRTVAAGGEWVPKDIRDLYNARLHGPELTPRELQAITLLSQGLSNREIATRLGVSEDGAKIHLKHINEKLGAKDRVDAVAIAIRKGIITPS